MANYYAAKDPDVGVANATSGYENITEEPGFYYEGAEGLHT